MAQLATARVRTRAGCGVRGAAVEALLERRTHANETFFTGEADRLSDLCRELAERFVRGGRLFAAGGSPQAWSDARHVAVEFVHPVIVGKRALPAVAVEPDELPLLLEGDDATIEFEPLVITAGERWEFDPPTEDPFVRQEICETLYHVLWELVHVFFEHLESSSAGAGASAFLYPFLNGQRAGLAAVTDDVRRSILMKAEEIGRLRAQTLTEGCDELESAASALRGALGAGGALVAFGNGGSATDAMDVVADFKAAPQGWPSLRALDLTADSAILTALANDIGPQVLFTRQLMACAREGDIALAISTSGGSANIVDALVEARRRGLVTIALVGYDGGRVAAEQLADHVLVTRSDHIPRIQEAQASAYHVLRELVELAG
jgi:D-sedoheptulose 7-phosphate isomerase